MNPHERLKWFATITPPTGAAFVDELRANVHSHDARERFHERHPEATISWPWRFVDGRGVPVVVATPPGAPL